jgi:hypothetical protein
LTLVLAISHLLDELDRIFGNYLNFLSQALHAYQIKPISPISLIFNLQSLNGFLMCENDPKPQLELLVPWDLPITQKLSETEQTKVIQALNQLLAALNHPDPQISLNIVQKTLKQLETIEGISANLTTTKTALKSWEVQDYDAYFAISHVSSQEPALCLVRSLLVAYENFLTLIMQYQHLESKQIVRQKKGFVSYVNLIARVFELDLSKNWV